MEPTWFGDRFLYFDDDHRIEDYGPSGIIANPFSPQTIHRRDHYMSVGSVNNPKDPLHDRDRRIFTDGALALAMFETELECGVFRVIDDLILLRGEGAARSVGSQWHWIAVQLSLPLIDLVGKLTRTNVGEPNNQTFKRGIHEIFGQVASYQHASAGQRTVILGALWNGLRCGVLHAGFLEATNHCDIQVIPETQGEPIHLRVRGSEACLEIRARPFVEPVARRLRGLIGAFKAEPVLRDRQFLPLWQIRWGHFPP